jgi:hypothetical protein
MWFLHVIMNKNKKTKTTKRIENKDDYEKSSFKDVIEDMENARDKGLESLPKIKKEQVPTGEEVSKEILLFWINHCFYVNQRARALNESICINF